MSGHRALGLAARANLVLRVTVEPVLLELVVARPGLAAPPALPGLLGLRTLAIGVRPLTLALRLGLSDLSSLLLLSLSLILLIARSLCTSS